MWQTQFLRVCCFATLEEFDSERARKWPTTWCRVCCRQITRALLPSSWRSVPQSCVPSLSRSLSLSLCLSLSFSLFLALFLALFLSLSFFLSLSSSSVRPLFYNNIFMYVCVREGVHKYAHAYIPIRVHGHIYMNTLYICTYAYMYIQVIGVGVVGQTHQGFGNLSSGACVHTHTAKRVKHANVQTCRHTYMYAHKQTNMHAYIHACRHTYWHTCIPGPSYIHIYIRVYWAHTYMHACIHWPHTYIHV